MRSFLPYDCLLTGPVLFRASAGNHRHCNFSGVSLSLDYHTQFWSMPEVTVTSGTSQFVYPEVANIQGKRTGKANQILPSPLGDQSHVSNTDPVQQGSILKERGS